MYDSREEAERRLLGTIVSFDGAPVYVTDTRFDGTTVQVGFIPHPFRLGSVDTTFVDQADPRWSRFQPVPLGFLNYFHRDTGFNVGFAERLPVRRQKQGLCNDNFSCSTLIGSMRFNWQTVYQTTAFDEMCRGVYPTYADALEHIIPGASIGVDRAFAIRMSDSGAMSLYNNREEVGVFFRGELFLNADRQYLLESIIENANLPDRVEIL